MEMSWKWGLPEGAVDGQPSFLGMALPQSHPEVSIQPFPTPTHLAFEFPVPHVAKTAWSISHSSSAPLRRVPRIPVSAIASAIKQT